MRSTLLLIVLIFGCNLIQGTEPLKVVCASKADKTPVIDGKLDDTCWKETEVRTDFTLPNSPDKLEQVTTMRFVYDDNGVYMGLEYYFDDIDEVKKAIQEILKKYGPPGKGHQSIKKVKWRYNLEAFFDPGATKVRYYQVMVNAAGQYTGNFMAKWDLFKGGHTFKSAIDGDKLVFEFFYPYKNLKAGDEWGFNLVRNDGYPYAIWKRVGQAFHNPKKFGALLMGDYKENWNAIWTTKVKQQMAELKKMEPMFKDNPSLMNLYKKVKDQYLEIEDSLSSNPDLDRKEFERRYGEYLEFKKDFMRLTEAIQVIALMKKKE